MPAPYVYPVMNPFEKMRQIQASQINLDLSRQELEKQRLQAEQQAAQQNDLSNLANLVNTGKARPEDYLTIMTKHPTLAANIKTGWDAMTSKQRDAEATFGQKALTALESNQPEIFNNLIDERIQALTNAGQEQEAKKLQDVKQMASINPNIAKVAANLSLAAGMGAENYAKYKATVGQEERAAAKAPIEFTKAAAEAEIAKIQAQFEPASQQADIAYKQAMAGNANAQTMASLEKSQRPPGIIPEEKKPEVESALRREVTEQSKTYRSVEESYNKVKSFAAPGKRQSGVDDMSLIFAYMKMLDPTSVVREGEQASAENAGGVPAKVRQIYNKVMNGEKFPDYLRQEFVSGAEKIYKASLIHQQTMIKGYNKIIQNQGLNPDNVFVYGTNDQMLMPPPGSAPQMPPSAGLPPPPLGTPPGAGASQPGLPSSAGWSAVRKQ